MLTAEQVAEVRELLAAGLPQREVARRTGIYRHGVRSIARGLHPRVPPPPPIGRCPRCGRLIELPCRACEAEGARGEGRGTREESIEPLGIELRGADRERYEALFAEKEREREARLEQFLRAAPQAVADEPLAEDPAWREFIAEPDEDDSPDEELPLFDRA